MRPDTLPVPEFFDPGKADSLWRVPYHERARQAGEWALTHGIHPASGDPVRTCLFCIDLQNTFCLPGFELFVTGRSGRGAVDDNIRLCRFIYRNLGRITEITATMDTHTAMQIFHPVFWVDELGQHPAPFTVIETGDVERGRWRVNPALAHSLAGGRTRQLQDHAACYVRRLSEKGKYPLIIWPYHAMLGGAGHALVPLVEEALFFHSIARSIPASFEIKGRHPLTENYSALRPEDPETAGGPAAAAANTELLERLLSFDAVIIAGQAKSHCVAWTVDDLLAGILARNPALARKVYLLEDCTSPVVAPGADFTEQAEAAFLRFAGAGMHVVRSTDPIEAWPGLPDRTE